MSVGQDGKCVSSEFLIFIRCLNTLPCQRCLPLITQRSKTHC